MDIKCQDCGNYHDISHSNCPVCVLQNKSKDNDRTDIKPPPEVTRDVKWYNAPVTLSSLRWGDLKEKVLCPHCQLSGFVHVQAVARKRGISGGKTIAAILTGGVSMLVTGLARKEDQLQAHCSNCGITWDI